MPITQDRLLGILEAAEFFQQHCETYSQLITSLPDLPELAELKRQNIRLQANIPILFLKGIFVERNHFDKHTKRNNRARERMETERRAQGTPRQTGRRASAPTPLSHLSIDDFSTEGIEIDLSKDLF